MLKTTLRYFTLIVFLCSTSLALATEAPGFTLKNSRGQDVSLSDYQGKVIILHFWATWCPYCKKLQPGLERLYQSYKGQGLELLGISIWEDEGADPQGALAERGHSFMTLLEGGEVAKRYGVKGTPSTFFIGRDGQVAGVYMDSNPDDPVLEQQVKKLLGIE